MSNYRSVFKDFGNLIHTEFLVAPSFDQGFKLQMSKLLRSNWIFSRKEPRQIISFEHSLQLLRRTECIQDQSSSVWLLTLRVDPQSDYSLWTRHPGPHLVPRKPWRSWYWISVITRANRERSYLRPHRIDTLRARTVARVTQSLYLECCILLFISGSLNTWWPINH